ncbi:MAG: response regulator [Actinobacteria bacterium]|nr:response regulator [Actinomycetota bacterium]
MTTTVVVADDDQDIRSLVSIAVGKAGLELVASVGDGALALEAILKHQPDLAILDVSMPEMTGLDVCRAVRSNDTVGDLRILLLSASVDEQSQSIGIEAGADYFLAKPFSPRELATWLSVGKEPR